ncbi:MAG: hypothetical protein AAF573_02250 [Bacteroidota bacterium]
MKKLKILFFLFGPVFMIAQSPAMDALKVAEFLESGDIILENSGSTLYELLINYTPYVETPDIFPDDIKSAFDKNWAIRDDDANPFIGTNPDSSIIVFSNQQNGFYGIVNPLSTSSSFLGSLGGLDVTTFADGLAKFLVKRFKGEMAADFLDDFRESLTTGNLKKFEDLLPQTHAVLSSYNVFNYTAYIKTLRESFHRDFKNLYVNLPEYLRKHELKGTTKQKELEILAIGLSIVQQIKSGNHPGQILNNVANTINSSDSIKLQVKESLQFVNFISQSMRFEGTENYWIPKDSLVKLVQNDSHIALYLGLVYQQLKKREAEGNSLTINGVSVKRKLKELGIGYIKIKPYIIGMGERIGLAERAMKDLNNLKPEDRKFEDYYGFIHSVLQILEFGMDSTNLNQLNITLTPDARTEVDQFLNITNLLNQLYWSLKKEEYESAVITLSELFEELLGNNYSFKNDFLKYGLFMATVIDAENSDQVEAAIEAIALPAGSSRIKRETSFSVDLNAFVGGFYGRETIHLNNISSGTKERSTNNVLGVASPVGIALSWGSPYRLKKWSGSIFISAIDIGALTAFRFQDDTTKALPKITLENIFAPGAYFTIGFPKSSVSLSVGAQYGPFLREIGNQNAQLTTEIEPNFRWGVSLTSDIPLLNFSTRNYSKRKKKRLRKDRENLKSAQQKYEDAKKKDDRRLKKKKRKLKKAKKRVVKLWGK